MMYTHSVTSLRMSFLCDEDIRTCLSFLNYTWLLLVTPLCSGALEQGLSLTVTKLPQSETSAPSFPSRPLGTTALFSTSIKPVFQIPSVDEGMAFCLEKHGRILAVSHNT